MDIQITINVPSETAAAPAAASTPAENAEGQAPTSSVEVSRAGPDEVSWFPLPPVHPAGADEPSNNGAAPDVALSPPGIEELETDFAADAADIPPPAFLTASHDAFAGDVVPPGLEELGPGSLPMGSDAPELAPPDPAVLEGAS